jgi:hypothetical protein
MPLASRSAILLSFARMLAYPETASARHRDDPEAENTVSWGDERRR